MPNDYPQRLKLRIMFQKHVFNKKSLIKFPFLSNFIFFKALPNLLISIFRILKTIQPLELHEMNLLELYKKLRMSDNDFERWMTNLGLLHSSMLCDNCQQPMIYRIQGRNRCWICDHTDCRFGQQIKINQFCQNSLYRGKIMRKIDCAHSRTVKMLP